MISLFSIPAGHTYSSFPISINYPIIDTISCPMNVNSFSDCSINTTTEGLCSSHSDTLYIECERGMISVRLDRLFSLKMFN